MFFRCFFLQESFSLFLSGLFFLLRFAVSAVELFFPLQMLNSNRPVSFYLLLFFLESGRCPALSGCQVRLHRVGIVLLVHLAQALLSLKSLEVFRLLNPLYFLLPQKISNTFLEELRLLYKYLLLFVQPHFEYVYHIYQVNRILSCLCLLMIESATGVRLILSFLFL